MNRVQQAIAAGAVALSVITVVLLLSSCAYPTRNAPETTVDDTHGYRWSNLSGSGAKDTLVIVTASGGGTRAATLELSVLEALGRIKLDSGGTLADRVDILSSVSGGSVTAAYFALKGTAGFPALEKFVRGDGVGAILAAGLNPVGLARISTRKVERIDLLIDYFDKSLFRDPDSGADPSFADLLAAHRRPFLILNAGDMVEGTPFAFTQSNFDLLCSDLAPMKLSVAVAASAAFPVALSPVTLTNYSSCDAQKAWQPAPNGHRLPPWAQADLATDWNTNPERAARGRAEDDYASGPPKKFIHLLDGGIADNLGIAEPFRILTTNSAPPSFLNNIANGNYKKIVFIMINARSFATSSLDGSVATPGILDMLLGTVDAGIDRTAAGGAARLRDALSEQFLASAAERRKAGLNAMADNLERVAANTHLIEIDFDAIADPACRQAFHNIGTSWTNAGNEIDALLLAGGALLGQSPQYTPMLAAVSGHYEDAATGNRPPAMAAACTALAGK